MTEQERLDGLHRMRRAVARAQAEEKLRTFRGLPPMERKVWPFAAPIVGLVVLACAALLVA